MEGRSESLLENAFMMMDEDDSGALSLTELKAFLSFIAPVEAKKKEISALSARFMSEADTTLDPVIDYYHIWKVYERGRHHSHRASHLAGILFIWP